MSHKLFSTAKIVHNPEFENAVVKVLSNQRRIGLRAFWAKSRWAGMKFQQLWAGMKLWADKI